MVGDSYSNLRPLDPLGDGDDDNATESAGHTKRQQEHHDDDKASCWRVRRWGQVPCICCIKFTMLSLVVQQVFSPPIRIAQLYCIGWAIVTALSVCPYVRSCQQTASGSTYEYEYSQEANFTYEYKYSQGDKSPPGFIKDIGLY